MHFAIQNKNIFLEDPVDYTTVIPPGNYNLCQSLRGLYLHKIEDFSFSHKLYNTQSAFINRVIKSFNVLPKSTGILLNGIKGTGKTVTAKQIAINSGLPVILISHKFDGLVDFINNLPQSCVIFIDEYEKVFEKSDMLLSVMDGAFSSTTKHLFILTTNDVFISPSMISRPGRIRYVMNFNDMSLDTINEILDDRLNNQNWRQSVIDVISSMRELTIDMITSVIDEVNIHNDDPKHFISFFNTNKVATTFIATTTINDQEIVLFQDKLNPNLLEGKWFNCESPFNINNKKYYGRVVLKSFKGNQVYKSVLYLEEDGSDNEVSLECIVTLNEKVYTHRYWRNDS